MRSSLWVIVLAGGKGERFWPLSTLARPKPFLVLGTGRSLLQDTLRRAGRVAPASRIRVIAGGRLAPAIRRELGERSRTGVIVEPAARNTGPAVLLATRWVWERDPRATVLILPSDHRVTGAAPFRSAVRRAKDLASKGYLVTFGIRPAGPEPDYGYILRGRRVGDRGYEVARFVEKPAVSAARRLLRRGALWNSGMFLWRAETFLQEAGRCEPSFNRWLRQCDRSGSQRFASRQGFRRLPAVPVDRAIMERSGRVAVVKSEFGWSDLGAWPALYDLGPKDGSGNARWGNVVALESRNNLVYSSRGLCVLQGVGGLMVVRAGDVVMVCPRQAVAGIREIVRELRKRGLGEYL